MARLTRGLAIVHGDIQNILQNVGATSLLAGLLLISPGKPCCNALHDNHCQGDISKVGQRPI